MLEPKEPDDEVGSFARDSTINYLGMFWLLGIVLRCILTMIGFQGLTMKPEGSYAGPADEALQECLAEVLNVDKETKGTPPRGFKICIVTFFRISTRKRRGVTARPPFTPAVDRSRKIYTYLLDLISKNHQSDTERADSRSALADYLLRTIGWVV
ncbi:hypothetical protein EVAR_45402_1 [Eumeta japonica]|uniref:Uncharacterized protein n=1 Tax=Eumeta variegata TaxID=151549 RepID=A0A4C1WT79_EUMVA|nr:hypothetical protein EVAR_45402_1 [Eumeta japonica]